MPESETFGNGRSSERRVPNSFGLSRVTMDEDEVNGGFDYDNRDNSYKLSTVVGNK